MINVKIIKKPKKASVASAGGSSSASFSKSTDRVSYADNADNADFAQKAGSADYAESAGRANYATEAGVAHDIAESSDVFNKFLRKDVDDAAAGEITFNGGTQHNEKADFGAFFSDWLLGTGARIDEEGNAEFKSLKVRESLDVAQLVFNKITARDAEDIISPGRGVISGVRKLNSRQGTFTLRLQENEWATVAENDICRGIYNNISAVSPNSWSADGEDANGFRKKKGFFTSYFRIVSLMSYVAGACQCRYELQSGTTEHPCENMVFCVYGNTTDTSRQNSIYITSLGISPRIVFLAGVNDFAVTPQNNKIALGNIEGLVVIEELADASEYNASSDPDKYTDTVDGVTHYYAHKTLEGDAGFFCEDNIYLGGVINQFKAAAMDAINAQLSNVGQAWVSASIDRYVIDCDENGVIENDNSFDCNFALYYGNNKCQITSFTARYMGTTYNGYQGQNGEWQLTLDFDEGDTLVSDIISVTINGTHNGTTYTASKTISIVANRQGHTGVDGAAGAAIIFAGKWASGVSYKWDADIRHCVKHNGLYWFVNVKTSGNTNLGEPATGNTNWLNVGALNFVATELLLAENGTIDLLSSNVINLFNGNDKTASINADGNGSYCIYYKGSGNKRMEFSSDGYIYYYNDDEGNTVAWKLGHGGDITKSSSDDWSLFPLHKLTTSEKQNLSENSSFELTNFWQFKSGSGGQFSAYDGRIYTSIAINRNPANGIAIPNGEYTRQYKPYQVLTENGTKAAIEVLTVNNGEIISTTEITAN